ncbi:MAG: hypothetical protein MPJ50_05360 [Pirellulales bacterium]|nr:hypothetical protein [Pirellulales bacterium]
MGRIEQKIVSDSKQAQRDIAQLQRKIVQMGEQLKKASESGKQGQEGFNKTIATGVAAVGSMVASWVSVQGAIRVANQLVEQHEGFLKSISQLQISAGDRSANLLRNIASLTPSEKHQVLTARDTIAEKRSQEVGGVAEVLSDIISAKGNISLGGAIQAADLSFQVAPESVDAARSIGQGILDTARITKSENPRLNLGRLQAVAANSRSTDLSKVARFQLRGIQAAVGGGATFEEGAALTTTLGFLGIDPEGATSGTATASLVEQLTQAKIPGRGPIQQIETLRQNAQLREQFLAGASFEKVFAEPIRQLVGKNDRGAGELLASQVQKIRASDPTALVNDLIGDFQTDPLQVAAAVDRRLKTAGNRSLISFLESGTEGAVTNAIPDIAQKLGINSFSLGMDFRTRRFFSDQDPLNDLIQSIRTEVDNPILFDRTAEQKQAANEMIRGIREIAELLRRQQQSQPALGTQAEGAR